MIRNVAHYDRSGSNGAAVADADALDDGDVGAEPTVAADVDGGAVGGDYRGSGGFVGPAEVCLGMMPARDDCRLR